MVIICEELIVRVEQDISGETQNLNKRCCHFTAFCLWSGGKIHENVLVEMSCEKFAMCTAFQLLLQNYLSIN